MRPLGELTIGPSDTEKWLGPITLGPDDDTLWLEVTQLAPVENWRYSYALVSFISDEGAELGTTKIYGNLLGEVFRLGVRRPPLVRTGRVRFVARHYNLNWLSAEGAPEWNLSFQWESGASGAGAPSLGTRATLGVLADLADLGIAYAFGGAIAPGLATVKFLPKP